MDFCTSQIILALKGCGLHFIKIKWKHLLTWSKIEHKAFLDNQWVVSLDRHEVG